MKAHKEDRFLRGRQMAYFIYEYFRVTAVNDSVENYADLLTVVLVNDDIQEFFSKWDGILLFMTKIPPDDLLEGLYKLDNCSFRHDVKKRGKIDTVESVSEFFHAAE